MVMMNSYSRSAEKPNNFRVLFFIRNKVTDETYRLLHKYIQNILRASGYITATKEQQEKILVKNPSAKFSGIDLSKTHTASLFYLPCKVIDRKEWAFFWKFNVHDNAELMRYAIDPVKVIQYAAEKTELPELIYEADSIADNKIDLSAIKQRLLSGEYLHLGAHYNYGKLAAAMRHSGFTLQDFIEVTPFVSRSKSAKDAEKFWNTWNKYEKITKGSLHYMINNRN
jgi:hypothetical protein